MTATVPPCRPSPAPGLHGPFLLAVCLLAPAGNAQGIVYSTLFGGGGVDRGLAVSVDDTGAITVVGQTDPPAPASTNQAFPYAVTSPASRDVFIARLDPAASGPAQLRWCTTLSGGLYETPTDLHVTSDGQLVTVVGMTLSANLPVTANAWQSAPQGGVEGFVLQLDGTGNVLYCSYLGGSGDDWANAISRDILGRLVILGCTTSPAFPTTAGAWQPVLGGGQDAFVTVLDPRLPTAQQLVHSTFLGGSGIEGHSFYSGMVVAELLDADVEAALDGSIVAAIRTTSTNLSCTPGAYQPVHNGATDLFVVRFDLALSTAFYATYLGGAGDETVMAIALRGPSEIAMACNTWGSALPAFPTTTNALQTTNAGSDDGALVLLDTSHTGASALRYGTLLGGPLFDFLTTVAIEDSGVLTAAGVLGGGVLGTPGAFLPNPTPEDIVVLRLDPTGATAPLHYLSFVNHGLQPGFERPFGMALHGDGIVTLTGFTTTPSLPGSTMFWTTPAALQAASNGDHEAIVLQFDPLPLAARRHGRSTTSCRGPVSMQVNSNPAPGNSALQLICNGAPPAAAGAFAFGAVMPPAPLLNADLLVVPLAAVLVLSDLHGAARLPLPLPPTMILGTNLGVQALWLTAPLCATGGPLAASHALQF